MLIRQVVIASAAIAAFSPAISNASPEQASLNACARALATSISAPTYHVDYRSSLEPREFADYYPSEYTFVMEARSSKTGAPLAKVRCSTDTHGTVTSIAPIVQN